MPVYFRISSFPAYGRLSGASLDGNIAGARVIPIKDLYSGRLIRDRAGEWQVIGFIDGSERDEFAGEIIDPVPFADVNPVAGRRRRLTRGSSM